MSIKRLCEDTTGGRGCRLPRIAGSPYCHIHQPTPDEPAPGDKQAILTLLSSAHTPLTHFQIRDAMIGPGQPGPITKARREWFNGDMQLYRACHELEGEGLIRYSSPRGEGEEGTYELTQP